MKRLLSLLTAVVFAIGLSGCFQPLDKDGMVFGGKKVEFLNIENKDVFDGGYYGMQFKYDDREPSYAEKITVTVYFESKGDPGTDWEVFVTDHTLPEFKDDVSYLGHAEPDLYNEGNMEIVSGQWIYVHCTCNAETSEAPSKGSFKAYYYADTGNVITYSPDEEFYRYVMSGSMFQMSDDKFLELPYYSADITGDGVEDRCTSRTTGSGMVRTQCLVYDMQNHKGYCLDGFNYDYNVVGVENGRLIVEEIGPNGYGDPTARVTGTVEIAEDKLVFVPDT